MTTIVLASGSPRRKELLIQLGIEPLVIAPAVDETQFDGEHPTSYVLRLAATKSRAVPDTIDSVVVAADTIVVVEGAVLGKPGDDDDARAMLRLLSNRFHQVVTGVAVRLGERTESVAVTTEVEFAPMDEADIEWYIATREPMDKAGAYAIQGHGGSFIRCISGSSTNVIGLPLVETAELFTRLGHPPSSLRSTNITPEE